jgi:hypothetical protein
LAGELVNRKSANVAVIMVEGAVASYHEKRTCTIAGPARCHGSPGGKDRFDAGPAGGKSAGEKQAMSVP